MSGDAEEEGRAERLLAIAVEAEPHMWGSANATWMDRLEKEYETIQAAFSWFLDHGRGADALELSADLWMFQEERGLADEARAWLAKALAAPGAEPRSITRARALYGAGILAFRNLDEASARQAFEECRAIAQEQNYIRLVVRSTTGFARLALRRGDTREVRKWGEEALAVARSRGEKEDAASPLHMLAAAARVEGDLNQAKAFYRENLALHRELGRMDTVAAELGNLGALEVLDGNISGAEPLLRESLEIAHKRKDMYLAPYQLVWLGRVALARGNPMRAATLFAAARSVFDATGLALDPDEAPEYEKGLAAIREALDDATFSATWSDGKSMSFDDAVALALRPE
jgi:tetratricopeptide (TPR) repeat protein